MAAQSAPVPPRLTVIAPPFLAERLVAAPPRAATLRVLAWDHGPLPAEAASTDVFVPWVTDRQATRRALSRLPASSWVCSISSGIDWFIEAVPPGVLVTGGQGLRSRACAEWVVAVTLQLVRGLDTFARQQRAREWQPSCFGTLHGATVLLLGHGAIGRAVEERLRPFGCEFLRVARRARPGVHTSEDLPDLIGEADVIVVAVPLTDSTQRLIDQKFLAAMRRGALLVNVARGPIVDTEALDEALRDGHIQAAIDVTDPEPLPSGHRLFSAPGLIITPHISGVIPGFADSACRFVAEQIIRRVSGVEPWNIECADDKTLHSADGPTDEAGGRDQRGEENRSREL
jgi:phosphoglycerate dehydrogenase-like enzyme